MRSAVDGALFTLSYGLSLPLTEEVIETEAVFHYAPGSRILSLGNIGCNMRCSFCQNWETSDVKNIDGRVVRSLEPAHVVDVCLRHGIDVISWTYNDPVVWHEFVIDTSKLAREHGIISVYKSALFIEEQPLLELIDHIDIFSISLKSMSPDFYREIARGRLEPVLDRIELLVRRGAYLELSQLVVTGSNDDIDDRRRTVHWVLDHAGDEVPLHFVAFHPAFKLRSVDRTPLSVLLEARDLARDQGVKHCYVGNVNVESVNDTVCESCGNVLVRRFGLSSDVVGIDLEERCSRCGSSTPIREAHRCKKRALRETFGGSSPPRVRDFAWSTGVSGIHVGLVPSNGHPSEPVSLTITHADSGLSRRAWLGQGVERLLVSKHDRGEASVRVEWEGNDDLEIYPLFDRAHFPVSR